jgi:DNA polymerase
MNPDRTEQLRVIRDEVVALQTPLAEERRKNSTHPVIGEGSHRARVMFIGEAPGKNEAATGRPFVGASGKILDELLVSAQLPREEVYITNIVKDRPPYNRDPEPEEIAAYGPFLDRQIAIIQPAVIATLGRYAMSYLFERLGMQSQLEPISKMHGREFVTEAPYGPVTLIPLYHPAVAIYNRASKEQLVSDFQVLRRFRATEQQP